MYFLLKQLIKNSKLFFYFRKWLFLLPLRLELKKQRQFLHFKINLLSLVREKNTKKKFFVMNNKLKNCRTI